MSLLIKNGTIVTALEEFKGDIFVEEDKIKAIGENLNIPADQTVDAKGKYILPGGIDQHVHFSFNYRGEKVRGFETSNAALIGGTTTVIEFVNQKEGKGMIETLEEYNSEEVQGVAMADYCFHGVAGTADERLFAEIPKMADYGVPTLKLFMAYKGAPYHCDDEAIFKALQASKKAGITIMVHAENADIIDVLQNQLANEGKLEPYYHAVSRPVLAEAEATQRAIYLSAIAGAPLYVVHVSCKEALEAIRRANNDGLPVFGETCTHYLVLDESDLARPDFEGAKYVCSPPLRTKEHREALWAAIKNNWLNAVSSDHCGFDFKKQKHMGRNNFADIPNGTPSLENRLDVLWTYGVEAGKISRTKLVELFATNPAKINGLDQQKGHIGIGYDADLVIFDPDYEGIITAEGNLQGVDYCPYEGMGKKGRVEQVYLRGRLTVEEGHFIGEKGQGQFIKGKPFGLCYR